MSTTEPSHGIVREARRPAGWQPPGPGPAGPGEREDLWPGPDEDLCFLTGDWRIFQRLKGHRWSLDDLATAWHAIRACGAVPPRRHVDIGCGIGSVLMMVAWRFPTVASLGVEAQALSVGMARRSIAYNGASQRVSVRHGDLRDDDIWAPGESTPDGGLFDLVTGTPPYLPLGHGVVSQRDQCGPCRHETRGGIEAYCDAAAGLLTSEGRFAVCEGANQIERVEAAAATAGLQILTRQDVVPKAGKAPLLSVYVMARRRPDRLPCRIEEPLVVRDADGCRTGAYLELRADMGMPP